MGQGLRTVASHTPEPVGPRRWQDQAEQRDADVEGRVEAALADASAEDLAALAGDWEAIRGDWATAAQDWPTSRRR